MADEYGGAKPKTRALEKNGNFANWTRGSNSSHDYSIRDVDDPLWDLKETSFSNGQIINGVVNKRENTNSNNVLQNEHKGAKPKLMKSDNRDLNLENDSSTRRTDVYNGMPVLNGLGQGETPDNKRLQEIGKLSKEREQEYLSARERWKKSGIALRKYIAEKLGFKQDKGKPGENVDMSLGGDRKRSPHSSADKKWKTKQEKLLSMDRFSTGSDGYLRQEKNIKSKSESVDMLKERKIFERSRSESSKDGDVLPRSRSFLRYLGLKKEKRSPKTGQNGLKNSRSCEMSSSDAWPESSTDTCKSAASDWSADNTLTSHKAGNSIWTNQKCQSTQTQHLIPSHKCDKGTKTEKINEHKHKSRTHRNSKVSKTSKDSKKSKQKDILEKNGSKAGRGRQKKEAHARKWVGILDNEIHTSSEEEFEFVLDSEHGEVVRRVKERTPQYMSEQQNSRSLDNEVDKVEGTERSKSISDSTVEAMLGLHHAVPYLPETFRSRLQAVQNPSDSPCQTTLDASYSPLSGETTAENKRHEDQREITSLQSETSNLLSDSFVRNKREHRPDKKKSLKNRDNWKKRSSKDDERLCDRDDFMYDTIEDYERNLEVSLEDPFNVRTNANIDLCSGLMDLVREIDIPFIDEDGDTRFYNIDKEADSSQKESNTGYNSSNGDAKTLSNSSNDFVNVGVDTHLDGLNETSFEDDPDYPGMKTLNDSFNRLLGEDDDTDTSTDSSVLNNFLQRSRSDESGSRTKSSDDSLEADDEFECECDHCQLLRQHNYDTNNLDLLPPRLYTEDMGFPYDLDLSTESSAAGQSDTESSRGFRSAMFFDEYDFLLDRSSNEVDWLIVDSRPLSVMLEDVIQQMLAVQPELLNEQAAPPAPQVVIENLPTITLTTTHIVQHPSCPICLCPCEMEEIMSLLPCQHIFHPICIQAWLIKSGTCPVCRGRISR